MYNLFYREYLKKKYLSDNSLVSAASFACIKYASGQDIHERLASNMLNQWFCKISVIHRYGYIHFLRCGMRIRANTTDCRLGIQFRPCPVRCLRESRLNRRIRHHSNEERSSLLQSGFPFLLANICQFVHNILRKRDKCMNNIYEEHLY